MALISHKPEIIVTVVSRDFQMKNSTKVERKLTASKWNKENNQGSKNASKWNKENNQGK